MTKTQLIDLCRLWKTSSWEWRSLFLRGNPPDVTGAVLKELRIGSAAELIEAMKAGARDE